MTTKTETTVQTSRIQAASARLKGHAREIYTIGGTQQGMFIVGASYGVRCACGWTGGEWSIRYAAERAHGDHKSEIIAAQKTPITQGTSTKLRRTDDGWEVLDASTSGRLGWVRQTASRENGGIWRVYVTSAAHPHGEYIRAGYLTLRKEAVAVVASVWRERNPS